MLSTCHLKTSTYQILSIIFQEITQTLVPSMGQMFELSPEKLLTKFGKSTFLTGKCLTLPDLKSLVIASNTPKNLMLEYFNKKI